MTNSVSFPEKMEEGTIDEAVPTTTTSTPARVRSTGDKRLSTVSKMYDIDGDGKLDEAEQAMRDMDKSGRGFLSNETVYKLMQEQLQMQKSLFQMKKIIVGLLVFVVILALSNLGTSFASAILAKDTTTNSESGSPELVDKKTGEVVATDQAVKRFTADELKLDAQNSRGLQPQNSYVVTASDFSTISAADAQALLGDCAQGNKIVKLTYLNWRARTVCGNDWTCAFASDFTYPETNGNPDPISGKLCLQGSNPMEYVYLNPDPNNSAQYIITADEPDFLTSDLTENCSVEADCDDGLICSSNECVAQPTNSPTKAPSNSPTKSPTNSPVPVLAQGEVCAVSPLECANGLTCVAEPVCPDISVGGTMLSPTACGSATSSTVAPGGGATDPCQGADSSGPICFNNVCGHCDATTCTPGSARPICVAQDGFASYCGCASNNDCGANETCGSPSCVADISRYCSANHDSDWGCNLLNAIQIEAGMLISKTCQEPTVGDPYAPACDSALSCKNDVPDGCSCNEVYEDGCGSDGIKYCNACVAEKNGATFIITEAPVGEEAPEGR